MGGGDNSGKTCDLREFPGQNNKFCLFGHSWEDLSPILWKPGQCGAKDPFWKTLTMKIYPPEKYLKLTENPQYFLKMTTYLTF
jgi:hypothetical protein